MNEENGSWAATKDQSIVMQMLAARIETAREKAETASKTAEEAIAREFASDIKARNDNKNLLSADEKEMVKEEIEEKIAQLSNLDHKKRIAKVFKDL
jgi:flagellar biosynthesis/type III secretory pathway M-ring protein FliF/YscJ